MAMIWGMIWQWYGAWYGNDMGHDMAMIWGMIWQWYGAWYGNDMGHDIAMMWHDIAMMWHDIAMMWHDIAMMWHDMAMMGHDIQVSHNSCPFYPFFPPLKRSIYGPTWPHLRPGRSTLPPLVRLCGGGGFSQALAAAALLVRDAQKFFPPTGESGGT